jgi:glutamyl-tRNA reductase
MVTEKAAGKRPAAALRRGELFMVGASHRTAPLEILESVALGPEEVLEALPRLRDDLGLAEVLILSTCNRTEIYGVSASGARGADALEAWFLETARRRAALGREHLVRRFREEAALHLFRVSAGIESMMLGETQIAGQVQEALELARRAGTAGALISRLFAAAARAQKRARSETAISEGSVSVASASVLLARRIFGDLSRRVVLVVGAGETGRLVAQHFTEHRPREILLCNRTRQRAVALAEEVGGRVVDFAQRNEALADADVVVCATRAPDPLFTKTDVRQAMSRRGSRMLLLVDVSLPRNIHPDVTDVSGVFLHDMNDLKAIVEQNLARRAKEVPAVERILGEELRQFLADAAVLEAGPLIRSLRESFETTRRRELDRFLHRFREEDRPLVERLTHDLVQKLLHQPTVELRRMAQRDDLAPEVFLWVRRLFGLEPAGADGAGAGESGPEKEE